MNSLRFTRCDAPASWVFLGVSLTFMWGAAAFVISPELGVTIWAFAVGTIIRRVRTARIDRADRETQAATDAAWDDRWARWGGRLPERKS